MQSVWHRRSNLGISPGSLEALAGEHRIIVAVDDVVGYTGVIGLLAKIFSKIAPAWR